MHLRDMRGASIVVIMLTVNQREKTLRALASFHASTHPPFKLLLWDNGSEDGTAEAVQQAFQEVLVHHHATNLGVASGRNAAAELAIKRFDPSHLLFIDNDMIVDPNLSQALLEPFGCDNRWDRRKPS
jgi:GT2 family glycosyltransferase